MSGRMITINTTIDIAGRLVIPKEISVQAGLKPGMPLELRCRHGCIEIEPAPLSVELVRKSSLLVALPQEEVGSLTAEMVEQTRQVRVF